MTQSAETAGTDRICVVCRQEIPGTSSLCPDDGGIIISVEHNPLLNTLFAGKYMIETILGYGATSIVYKAKHLSRRDTLAIKVLHPHLLADEQVMQRFEMESAAASSLNDDHIINVVASGVSEDGLAYFVMEYIEGVTLEQILDTEGCLPAERALLIFMQICQGLAHAHKNGVLHRDLKPSNILIFSARQNNESVKLLDFGVAKLLGKANNRGSKLTLAGEVCGTPSVLSPESCLGRAVDERSDVYSLGCLMYETLTGLPPFLGDSTFETMSKHVNEPPPSFSDTNPDVHVPEPLAKVVFHCLEKNPDKRFQTVDSLAASLSLLID